MTEFPGAAAATAAPKHVCEVRAILQATLKLTEGINFSPPAPAPSPAPLAVALPALAVVVIKRPYLTP